MELFAVLQVIWWLLLGVLLIGLAVMVGMDMGVGTILRYVGRNDLERRVALNIIGPHWDGNQVWFILGGGAIFAAFPLIYATAFSGFYVVMLLLLWTMIVRPLGFEYRSKIASAKWRNVWDWTLFISGAVPMIVFGAAFGNLFHGVPFHFEWNITSVYTGSFLGLLNPFAIMTGLLALALSVMMGALTVMNGAEGAMYQRARTLVQVGAIAGIVLRQALPISPRMERFWDASARVARLSGWLAQQLRVAGLQPEDAYTFGLFRDCGIPILLTRFPNYDEVLGVANHNARHSFTTVEETVLPTNHAMVGCLLAQSWWLPDELCQAIRNHHDLAKLESAEPQLLVSNRLSAVAQFAEHLVQQHLGLSQTQEWTKLGPACLRLLDLEEQQLAELYSESLPVAKADD